MPLLKSLFSPTIFFPRKPVIISGMFQNIISVVSPPDINECSAMTSCGDPISVCVNTLGGFACHCKGGYTGSGRMVGGCLGELDEILFGILVFNLLNEVAFSFLGVSFYLLNICCRVL